MKKRSITLIIWLMSIALLGVVAMQYYFVRESYKQKSLLFDEAVNASLAAVAGKIEKQEIVDFAQAQERLNREKYRADQEKQQRKEKLLADQLKLQERVKDLQMRQFDHLQRYKDQEDNLKSTFPNAISIENDFYETYIRREQYRGLLDFEVSTYADGSYLNADITVFSRRKIPSVPARDDSTRFVIPVLENDRTVGFRTATLMPKANAQIAFELHAINRQLAELHAAKFEYAESLFDTLAIIGGKSRGILLDVEFAPELAKRPFRERINIDYLRGELAGEMAKRGIAEPFNLEIRDSQSQTVYRAVANKGPENRTAGYTALLFENDLGNAPGMLSVHFPQKNTLIRNTMGYLLLPMAAMLALLIGSFGYTLSIVFKQKKISEMKTDFMNNMTHEFKTPVSTIMIASESLRDPEIAAEGNRVSKLANIIYEENVRLGNHIERVLNIARLEKENLKMEKADVRINSLLENVLDSMQLQMQKAHGTLHMALDAARDLVVGDELHLSNVFFNLLDNAIKYSKDSPQISVRTFNGRDCVSISIADRGMGMTKEQKDKIFDQFYRIPTGNVHNVKGFGLGLSYVHDIVKRLNGKIQVKSEKDKGTVFEMTFPLKGTKPD